MSKYHQDKAIVITEVELRVKNLSTMRDYYENAIGLTVIENEPEKVVLSVDGISPLITLVENTDALRRGQTVGLYHFAILLPERHDLGLFLRHVIKNQVSISGAADHGVSEAIYLQDPENNGIEVYVDKDDSTWYDEFGSLIMVTEELDYTGVYYAAADEETFMKLPKDTIMGHLHLSVSSLAKAKQFYVDALGFEISLDTYAKALFTRTAHYHHHLGLNTWMGERLPLPNTTGLKSFVVRYPDCDSIQRAIETIKSLNLPITEINDGYQTSDYDGNTIYLRLNA